MESYSVYKHTFPNNKVYIGMTYLEPSKRWNCGYGYRGLVVGNAINKYGWENVKHEILFEGLTKEEAEQKERELIAQYKSNQREFGYNVANGGNHRGKVAEETKMKISIKNKNHPVSKEAREKISKRSKEMWQDEKFREEHLGKIIGVRGKPSWNKGIPQSEEAKEKNRQKHIGKKIWCEGKKLSKEHIAKMKLFEKGHTPWNKGMKNQYKMSEEGRKNIELHNYKAKQVRCLETGKIYRSGKKCAETLKIERSGVTRACTSKTHYYKGYHFEYVDKD